MSEIGVITNPTSGSGRGAKWGAEAMAELARYGHRLRDLSAGSWVASYENAMAHRRHLDALVVVGGDGMVHLGAQVCAERRLPLGIIAAGSGNDVASQLGLPLLDIVAAARAVHEGLGGQSAQMDVGKLTGPAIEHPSRPRYFLAVLSAGIDAAVAAYAQSLTFPRGPMKYKYAAVREIPRFKPYGVKVTIDGAAHIQQCTLVAVANTAIFGGGLMISPESSVFDGRLEVVLADEMSKRHMLSLLPKLNDGSHVGDPRIRIVQATKVDIIHDATGAPLPAAFADGERVGAQPLSVRIAPGALRVLGADGG